MDGTQSRSGKAGRLIPSQTASSVNRPHNFMASFHDVSKRTHIVVGVGKGTKKLSEFLDCVKVMKTLHVHA